MMKISIDRSLIGTDRHLVCNGVYSWTDRHSDDSWILGGADVPNRLDDVLEILSLKIPESDKMRSHRMSVAQLLSKSDSEIDIPVAKMMVPSDLMKYVSEILKYISNSQEILDQPYYRLIFPKIRQATQYLQNARVDRGEIFNRVRSEELESQKTALSSFLPERDDLSRKVVYRHDSSTGRFSVKSGPQILTLRKENRDIIVSRHKRGSIRTVDYVSLEPRICLAVTGKDIPIDIYEDLMSMRILSGMTRKSVKIAVMGSLFGITADSLQSIMGDSGNAHECLREIRAYFGIDSLGKRLVDEFNSNGSISNFYGRKLAVPRSDKSMLVAYYIQSTGVDIAILGFLDLFKRMSSSVVPLFFVHDAALIDIQDSDLEEFTECISSGMSIPGFDVRFPLKLT